MLRYALFFIILAVFAARPMISERFEHIEIDFLQALHPPEGPSPATTAILDLVLLIAGGAALATQATRRGWTVSDGHSDRRAVAILLALLALAVGVSTLAADDRLLAALAGTSLFAGALGGVALAAQMRAPWLRRVAIAALLATGGVTAIKSIHQCTDEWTATRELWSTEQKPALLKQGFRADDRLIINFERRLMSREAHGFLAHPNLNASVLMMCGLAGGGVLLAAAAMLIKRRRRAAADGPSQTSGVFALLVVVAGLAYLAGIVVAGSFCGSLGAAVAAVGGAVVVVAGGLWAARASVSTDAPPAAHDASGVAADRRLRQRATAITLALGALYVAGLAGGAAYGIAKGTLPTASMEFRWYYWTAAARAYAEAPWTGIGRGNFTTAYMRFKAPQSTEEVRDAHNLWVSLLTETGPLGLIAGAGLVFLIARRGVLRLVSPRPAIPEGSRETSPSISHALRRLGPVIAGVTLVHALFSATPFGVPGMALTWLWDVPLQWALIAIAAYLAIEIVAEHPAARRWLTAGLLGAAAGLLVHSTLDFTLMSPGGFAVFALVAVALAGSDAQHVAVPLSDSAARRAMQFAVVAIVVLAVLADAVLIAIPSIRANAALERLRADTPLDVHLDAAARCAASADMGVRRAGVREFVRIGRDASLTATERLDILLEGRTWAERLAARAPRDSNAFVIRAQLEDAVAAVAEASGDAAARDRALRAAADAWERAAALYPTNPRTRIAAGFAWLRSAGAAAGPDVLARVRGHFEAALRIDNVRKPEEVQRLRPAERDPVEQWLREHPA